jgi:hypothetical protein
MQTLLELLADLITMILDTARGAGRIGSTAQK